MYGCQKVHGWHIPIAERFLLLPSSTGSIRPYAPLSLKGVFRKAKHVWLTFVLVRGKCFHPRKLSSNAFPDGTGIPGREEGLPSVGNESTIPMMIMMMFCLCLCRLVPSVVVALVFFSKKQNKTGKQDNHKIWKDFFVLLRWNVAKITRKSFRAVGGQSNIVTKGEGSVS